MRALNIEHLGLPLISKTPLRILRTDTTQKRRDMSYELYTTKHWMILPSFVHGILPTLMYNSNNHIALGTVEKKQPYLAIAGGSDYIRDAQVTEDGEVVPRYDGWGQNLLAGMKEPFVNVIPIDGPITRNGDACSYGSKDIRDWLMEAAANKYCRAHVLVVNTPGGSAWAKNDFQQAIDFAHANGQRVYMLIDGLCASAGMYLASFCDEVYVVNLKDQLGCVGVMASFFTLGDGEKVYTNETYHELYATKSINKNKEMRDIANDNDSTLLIEELDKLESEFRSDMQAAFPQATDDHLDGKVFDADEVMGILCDGQMLLGEVVARAFAVANGSEEPIERTANRNIGQPADVSDEDEDDNQPASDEGSAGNKQNVSPKNSTIMTNEKYQIVAEVLGVEELNVTEEGTFLNAPLLDTLAEKLTAMKAGAAAAQATEHQAEEQAQEGQQAEEGAQQEQHSEEGVQQEQASEEGQQQAQEEEAPAGEQSQEGQQNQEKQAAEEGQQEQQSEEGAQQEQQAEEHAPASEEAVQAATEDIDKIQETLHNAEQMIADKDKEIADLKESLDGQKNAAEQLQADIDQARKDIETANGTIAERDATIAARDKSIEEKDALIDQLKKQVSDLKAEVKELAGKPAPMTDAAAGIPQDNGTGEAPKQKKRITRDMSYEEIRAAKKAAAEEAKK